MLAKCPNSRNTDAIIGIWQAKVFLRFGQSAARQKQCFFCAKKNSKMVPRFCLFVIDRTIYTRRFLPNLLRTAVHVPIRIFIDTRWENRP